MYKASKEQIEKWKAEHGEIFYLTVGDKACVLKAPDRKVLGYASTVGTKDPFKFNEILLKNCWLDGDMEIQTQDSYFVSASQKLSDLIGIKEVELVKL